MTREGNPILRAGEERFEDFGLCEDSEPRGEEVGGVIGMGRGGKCAERKGESADGKVGKTRRFAQENGIM